jgi:hypothetical protein
MIILTTLLLGACTSADGPLEPTSERADDPASCAGAELDASEVCRLEDGTFAPESCCDLAFGEDGTFDDGSGIGCIFGEHLVDMARMADLDISDAQTIDASTPLEGIVKEQVLDTAFDPGMTLEEVIDSTDDAEIDLLTVRDEAHRRNFKMYVWSAGDNTVGRIYYSQSLRIAAEIGDGSIGDCDAGYSNYDDLPFFYTN